MNKNIKILFFLISTILLTSCGFQKISQNKALIHFKNINTTGENRIAYKLKNSILLVSNEMATTAYDVDIEVIKKKSNKIKNDKGKVTRYSLNISANMNFNNINTQEIINRSFTESTDYNIAKNHSQTKDNEINATRILVDQLSESILNFITISIKN